MRSTDGLWLAIIASSLTAAAHAAPLTPQLSPEEQAHYAEMLKMNPTGAKTYLATRDYVSACRQVIEHPDRALDLPDEPDDFDERYVTADERPMIKMAIQKALTAYIASKGGL